MRHLFGNSLSLFQLLLQFFIFCIFLSLLLDFLGLLIENTGGMMNRSNILRRSQTFLRIILIFLRLFIKLIYILFNISPDSKHIVNKLIMVGPHLMSATIILNQTVFLFKSMIEDNPGLLSSQHQRIIN